MRADCAHQRSIRLVGLLRQRGRLLRRLRNACKCRGVTRQLAKGLRIRQERRHHLRLAGQCLEARTRRERAEARVVNHQLECVGLHQLRNRGVSESDILLAHLRGDVAIRRRDRARAGAERRVHAAQTVRSYTYGEYRRSGHNHRAIIRCRKARRHVVPHCSSERPQSASGLT